MVRGASATQRSGERRVIGRRRRRPSGGVAIAASSASPRHLHRRVREALSVSSCGSTTYLSRPPQPVARRAPSGPRSPPPRRAPPLAPAGRPGRSAAALLAPFSLWRDSTNAAARRDPPDVRRPSRSCVTRRWRASLRCLLTDLRAHSPTPPEGHPGEGTRPAQAWANGAGRDRGAAGAAGPGRARREQLCGSERAPRTWELWPPQR